MPVSNEGKAAEIVQIAQLIFCQTAVKTVSFVQNDVLVKIINYLVTIAIRN